MEWYNAVSMRLFELTRQLVDIESISGHEKNVALFLEGYLRKLGAEVELEEAEPDRPNVLACWGKPDVGESVVFTSGASPVTSTVCCTSPTSSARFSTAS